MRVKEIMTPKLISVRDDASLLDGLRTLVESKVSALAVVDAAGALVGVLSEGDLLRRSELGAAKRRPAWLEFILGGGRSAEDYQTSHSRRVSGLMTRGARTIAEDADIAEAVDEMIAHKIRRLIVTKDGAAVGIVSRSDIVKALLDRMPKTVAPHSDAEILATIAAEFDRESWAPRGSVRALCVDGVVTLEGAISDERIRPALKTLVENVEGVKSVKDRLAWIEPNSGYLVPSEGDEK